MKLIYYFVIAFTVLLGGCNDSFLDKYPETSVSPEVFFNNVKDLELYTNTFYGYIYADYQDGVTDNSAVFADVSETLNLLRGNITPSTVGGWNNWGELRRINFFLDNAHSATGDPALVKHYIGIGRLMRARWYYNMVKRYNDVPWYSNALKDTDEEFLYKERDPRTLVVDSVMADLDYAVNNISPDLKNKTVISSWFAYANLARIALHEGTFRKYHDELPLQQTADAFLEKAVQAASVIMDSGLFSIDQNGGPQHAYGNLFINLDLSKSPEVILFKDYDLDENIKHPASAAVFDHISALSKDLMESYQVLTPEGNAVPFSSLAGHDQMDMVDVFENRDPRMRQTFMYPGYIKPGQSNPYRPNLNLGGYPQIKFVAQSHDQVLWGTNYTDLPVVRLAEIYLIYAEAKAELGQLTQGDLDRTVNQIRNRAGMPPTILGQFVLDPILAQRYPNVAGPQREEILEIRRERRVELACEGLRLDDLMRWKAGHLLGKPQQGVYINHLGLHDFTGDGVPDIGIYKNESSNDVPAEERSKYAFYYLETNAGDPNSIYLSEGDSGYIMAVGDRDGVREFKDPQYYYFPVPQTQRILNPNLQETIFW